MPTKSARDRVSEKSRADLLAEIADLPPSAFIPTAHAAAYLGSTPGVMLNWRSQRRGPRYHGKNDFVRYRICDLDLWMSSRADEIRSDKVTAENLEPTMGGDFEVMNIAQKLPGRRKNGSNWMARCPAHEGLHTEPLDCKTRRRARAGSGRAYHWRLYQ